MFFRRWLMLAVTFSYTGCVFAAPAENIVERLKKVSTEQVADAFDTLGIKNHVINNSTSHIAPINDKKILCGKAYTIQFSDLSDSRPAIGKQTRDYLDAVPKNRVIMIENTAGNDYAVWGSLLSLYASRHGISGVITNGSVRDANIIKTTSRLPVFATGTTNNRSNGRYKVVELQKPITIGGVTINPGDYVLASHSGIVIIDPMRADAVLTLAEKNRAQEEKIAALMNQGHSLSKIDKIMAGG